MKVYLLKNLQQIISRKVTKESRRENKNLAQYRIEWVIFYRSLSLPNVYIGSPVFLSDQLFWIPA